jgi:sec-independent protein translocase protein TatA
MLGNIGPLEILVVLIIALIVFGPKRLPELGSSLGRGIREFRGALSGDRDSDEEEGPKRLEGSPARTGAEEPARPEASSHNRS